LEWAFALKKHNLKHRRLRMTFTRETASSGWKDVVNAWEIAKGAGYARAVNATAAWVA
jgi:hypothetical protein